MTTQKDIAYPIREEKKIWQKEVEDLKKQLAEARKKVRALDYSIKLLTDKK